MTIQPCDPAGSSIAQSMPFTIHVPEETLADLRYRLEHTQWPKPVPRGGGWEYGTDTPYLRELVDYWLHDYDWREEERKLNLTP